MRRSLARTLVLGCLIARVAGMVRNAPKLTPPVPLQPLQQFQRLQPLEQAAIPAIAINPVYKPTVKDRAKAVFNEYLLLLERKPFTTKAVSAAVVGGIGDIVSQSLTAVTSRIHFKWDLTRTITFMLIGLLYRGPIMHVWLNTLERFGQKMTPRLTCPMKRSLAILAIDQTLGVAFFYPLFYVVHEVFSSFMSLQAPSLMALKVKMASTLLPVIMAQYSFWPLAQFVSFRYCPTQLRTLYCDLAGILWNCFLCAQMAK